MNLELIYWAKNVQYQKTSYLTLSSGWVVQSSPSNITLSQTIIPKYKLTKKNVTATEGLLRIPTKLIKKRKVLGTFL